MVSYNPLKMFGSWLGGIILFLFCGGICISFAGVSAPCQSWWSGEILLQRITDFPGSMIIFFSIGFLLGWVIHSLVRVIKNSIFVK